MTETRHRLLPLDLDAPRWGPLYGSAQALAAVEAAQAADGVCVLVTDDAQEAERLMPELRFFAGDQLEVLRFPDWETLPYDVFSPHQDIVSDRLEALYRLPGMERGLVVITAATLMQRLPPRSYVEGNALMLAVGETLDVASMSETLGRAGYQRVNQVMEHGEFAIRGALFDLFPMGSDVPYRIDLLDDEVETIRVFDPEDQRSIEKLDSVRVLPAREFPLDPDAIGGFRRRYRQRFEGDPQRGLVYRAVSDGQVPGGIEYFLPLFFEETSDLFDYLPGDTLMLESGELEAAVERDWVELVERHQERAHDVERPILSPEEICDPPTVLLERLERLHRIRLLNRSLTPTEAGTETATAAPPALRLDPRAEEPVAPLVDYIAGFRGRVLICAESAGRRETLLSFLREADANLPQVEGWSEFLASDLPAAVCVAAVDRGLMLPAAGIALVAEPQLFGERTHSRRRRRARDPEAVLKDLSDLMPGSPVIHEEHGVGRYLGLQVLEIGATAQEFLTLEYAGEDRLYVPVSSLHLISRYTGASPERAPLHKLGSDQWERAKRRAAKRARDVAAELLDVYARRAARGGEPCRLAAAEYRAFAEAFPFELTEDQEAAIDSVVSDLTASEPMDRLVCGDVGFGKTEVALRAAFVAAMGGRQVAMLVPTTLLAQQHHQSFADRFADWPVRIEVVSRFRSNTDMKRVMKGLVEGDVDIVIGTHRLLQDDVRFDHLGLVIIDEEHRFGVRHKERLKKLRAEVDVLTLTATPIPRTLNMAMGGLRDLSIIATPPAERLSVRTFVSEWDSALIREACLREIRRGGQIYFLHNSVETIERTRNRLAELVPEADVRIAHGQMPETDLERVMLDFYHRRFNLLLCTTIIESGIDIPTANTIIIDRADKLGLAQLHQLRGRVGRSHHRAYAYLIAPPRTALTPDAEKRLEAIESLEELGAGFTLATHDLEIRGAGELLGEGQSGRIQEVGFTLFAELLERAVKALRKGEEPALETALDHGTEVEMGIPALFPDDYIPDVHNRLVLYKRLNNAADPEALREIQVELIDRFGLLPPPAEDLVRVMKLKQKARTLGIRKLEANAGGGRILFEPEPAVEPMTVIRMVQQEPTIFRMDGQDQLRFRAELRDPGQRFEYVEALLATLAA